MKVHLVVLKSAHSACSAIRCWRIGGDRTKRRIGLEACPNCRCLHLEMSRRTSSGSFWQSSNQCLQQSQLCMVYPQRWRLGAHAVEINTEHDQQMTDTLFMHPAGVDPCGCRPDCWPTPQALAVCSHWKHPSTYRSSHSRPRASYIISTGFKPHRHQSPHIAVILSRDARSPSDFDCATWYQY